jgi:hypothetical protein
MLLTAFVALLALQQSRDTIQVSLSPRNAELHVSATFPSPKSVSVVFRLPSWAGVSDFNRFVTIDSVRSNGKILPVSRTIPGSSTT